MRYPGRTERSAIAVIGLGPRGMVLVERLIAQLRNRPRVEVDLLLFDSNAPGPGLHRVDLPDYLLLNTVAGQLSFYPHPDAAEGTTQHIGPTLDQWCRARNIRLNSRGEIAVGTSGRDVVPGDFLPRRVLGAYLADCSRKLLESAPANVRVRLFREEIVDTIRPEHGRHHWLVSASGRRYKASHLFLSLGHSLPPATSNGGHLDTVKAGETVAISGLGLTAIDMVAALTKGRGGIFAGAFDQLRYLRSGREPKILLYSSTGLPFCARPDWSPQDDAHRSPAVFFTRAAIDRLRQDRASERLDFRADVLPLIELEMRTAFHITKIRLREGPAVAEKFSHTLSSLNDVPDAAMAQFRFLEENVGSIDLGRYLRTEQWRGEPTNYAGSYSAFVSADLQHCKRGIARSPVKAALEVWRSQRDTIRYAVNGTGLTDVSRAEFYRVFAPLSNRLVGGPQKERHAELLALIAAGVVDLLPPQPAGSGEAPPVGSSPPRRSVGVSHHVSAYLSSSGLQRNDSPLLRNLFLRGRVRKVGGTLDAILVDAHGNPIGADGAPDRTVWIVGPAVEGASFYNHYVGTPDPVCPLFVDAQREVARCLDGFKPTSGTQVSSARNYASVPEDVEISTIW